MKMKLEVEERYLNLKVCFEMTTINFLLTSLSIFEFITRKYLLALVVKNPPANARDVRDTDLILCWEDPLEEGMATYSSILAWEVPWAEEPGGLQSTGSQRVGCD